ncbi:hypothetical protein [Hymenobacter sp.]|jgi:hypothetical protein|uniref:hypothetical protein n=1 Tax=Hymenobacter sp. TaxID=1898978 RepID=UPI002ED8C332
MEKLGLRSIDIKYLIGRDNLKRDILYFDKILYDKVELQMSGYLVDSVGKVLLGEAEFKEVLKYQQTELDYLTEAGLLVPFDSNKLERIAREKNYADFIEQYDEHRKQKLLFSHSDVMQLGSAIQTIQLLLSGQGLLNGNSIYNNYFFSVLLNRIEDKPIIPVTNAFVPETDKANGQKYQVLELVLGKLPMIDDSVSWEQIIDFKADPDSKLKFARLQSWMIDLSRGNYDKAEASDKLEHLYQEYTAHMRKHKVKSTYGTLKSVLITGSEIIEDLAKLKWSKVVKTLFDIADSETQLMDAQNNAPGKEVAYIYHAAERFSAS